MKAYEVVVKRIPEHFVYYKEYLAKDHLFFLDKVTGENYLQTLSDKVMDENPEIQLTDPDYNYFLYLDDWFENGGKRIHFCDRVTAMGRNTDEYQFRKMGESLVACVLHEGPFEQLKGAHAFAEAWLRQHQCHVCGYPRDSFIHGFWDKDNSMEYLTEVQIPISR